MLMAILYSLASFKYNSIVFSSVDDGHFYEGGSDSMQEYQSGLKADTA